MLARQLFLRHTRHVTVSTHFSASHARAATTVAVPEAGVSDPKAYCRDLVQKRDYEAHLVSQFFPRESRDAFCALRAFYVSVNMCLLPLVAHECLACSTVQIELATVQETVSNAIIGNMRMQFWRDAVKGISEVRASAGHVCLR